MSFKEQGLFVNCSDCLENEMSNTNIEVLLDNNSYGVLVQLWEGNLEDSILISTSKVYYSTFTFFVNINKTYTVTATYIISDNKYIAIDSATPRVKYTKNLCEYPCYYVYDRICDLRLKYTK